MARGAFPDERWAEVETLFQQATDIPAGAARDRFLDERCGADAWLRAEVLSLLQFDTREESPLLDALHASAASTLISEDLVPGRMVGAWRIERELGRGGMAVVYLAARADGEFRKQVAIKVIKRGMDTTSIIERLRRERRILAALEHPSIARLVDGGTLPDGRPWIAMEYVDGVPIDRYCDCHSLGIDERCRLLDKVFDAVAAAHRNLVIHRDLKPGNILVTGDGNPKLLDFGIARLLDAGSEETADGPLTLGSPQPLTPQYASPEQMRGEPVGTATDVYSLGVVVYELLAGARPAHDREKAQPIRASAAALVAGKDRQWSKRLTGDIDAILQMALRPEPDRRYLSVEQMQADLRRHLAGMPVVARNETWPYRCAKFFARHRVAAPVAAIVALAAIAAVIAIVRAERDAQAQRAKAEQRLGQMVELANSELFNIHDSIEHLPGALDARRQVVESTLQYLDRLNAESGGDPRVLETLASAYTRVAKLQGSPMQPNLGDQKGAEQSYLKAAAIFDTLARHGPESAELRLRDAEFRDEYGKLIYETGRAEAGVTQYERGIAQVEAVLRLDPHNFTARKDKALLQYDEAEAFLNRDTARVIRTDEQLFPAYDQMLRERPGDPDLLLNLAAVRNQAGNALQYQDRFSEAIESFRKAAELCEQIYALHPQDIQIQREMMMTWGHLGDNTGSPMFLSLGDFRTGAMWYEKAVAMARKMAVADSADREARNDEGTALVRLAAAQQAAGQTRAAIETFRQSEALLTPLFNASPRSMTLKQRFAAVHLYRARAYRDLNDTPHEIEDLRKALKACSPDIRNHSSLSCPHIVWLGEDALAVALAKTGDIEGATREAAKVLEEVRHPDNPNDATLPAYLARALAANGAVHLLAATHRTGEQRTRERRAAAGYYRQALAHWNRTPHNTFETYHTEMEQAKAALAEAER